MQTDALLRPTSIAIVGASERPSTSQAIMSSLGALRYTGEIFPVNPKYEEILGYRCYASLADIPQAPDVVAFCVRASRILPSLEIAAELGVRAAVIYDGGFAERDDEGLALQAAISGLCLDASIALCGPNCMGVLNPHDSSSIYMQEIRDTSRLAGNVGLVSQSGSICIGMLADLRRFGFSHVISSGNEAVVPMADYLEALVDDPETRVIALFVETVRQADRFVAALDRAAAAGKPVVVLKVGRSERTARAITTHTGGLAGSSRVFSEVLRAHRAIETTDFDELTEVLAACQSHTWPKGRRLAVVTGSGGQAELILDVATAQGLDLPPLPDASRREVERIVGPITGDGNPLDAWGNGDFRINFPHALATLDGADSCDVIAMCLDAADGQPMSRPEAALLYVEILAEAARKSAKPHFMLGTRPGVMMTSQVEFLREHGLALVGGSRQGLGAIDRVALWALPQAAFRPESTRAGRLGSVRNLETRRTVNEVDSKTLLAAHGLPVTRERRVADLASARDASRGIGYPVVLKVVSDEIAHKSDLGLVIVGIKDEAALDQAFDEMTSRVEAVALQGQILGFVVQEMVTTGIEVFAGVNLDPDFGLVLAFGLGGVAIEILQDVSLRMLPLREGDAAAMVAEIKASALLAGVRGAPPSDVDALIRCLEGFGDFAWADRDRIAEIDLNPIKVLERGMGCRIVDALIVPRT